MRTLLTPILFLLLAASTHAQAFSSLEERMSASEFRAAGLDKLSAEELARLNAWLEAHLPASSGAPAMLPPAALEDRRGLRENYSASGPIVSRIDGEFTGWDGSGPRKTRFALQNGQIWEQIDTNVFHHRATDPVVSIEPAMMDSWLLKLEGSNRSVRVRRVR